MSVTDLPVSGSGLSPHGPARAIPSRPDLRRLRVVPVRHSARTFWTVVAVAIALAILNSILGNPRWG